MPCYVRDRPSFLESPRDLNRTDFQLLAQLRIDEAQTLLGANQPDGAYYLAGYAVECALKSCIARQTREFDFPDRSLVNQMYTHDLERLIGVASLQQDLNVAMNADPNFAVNWALVKDWTEDSRYRRHDANAAREFVTAIVDK